MNFPIECIKEALIAEANWQGTLKKFAKKIDWEEMSNEDLPEDFIERYANFVDWNVISYYQTLSEEFIDRFADRVDWRSISRFQTLSEAFISQHSEDIYWDEICSSQKLSIGFIQQHLDKIDWDSISRCQNLPEDFIEQHTEQINWENGISRNRNISEEFLEKHADKLNWSYVSSRSFSSEAFFGRNTDRLDWSYVAIVHYNMSLAFMIKYMDRLFNHLNWKAIAKRIDLTREFIDKYKEKLSPYRKHLRHAYGKMHALQTFQLNESLPTEINSIVISFT